MIIILTNEEYQRYAYGKSAEIEDAVNFASVVLVHERSGYSIYKNRVSNHEKFLLLQDVYSLLGTHKNHKGKYG